LFGTRVSAGQHSVQAVGTRSAGQTKRLLLIDDLNDAPEAATTQILQVRLGS
jgi:hypothetical protein